MHDSKGSRRLIIARISLVLFILGVLTPLLTALAILRSQKLIYVNTVGVGNSARPLQGLDAAIVLAIGIGFLCELLAFLLGIFGWRHVSGKIGLIGGFIMAGLQAPFWVVWLIGRFWLASGGG
jgi:hypothetical protein